MKVLDDIIKMELVNSKNKWKLAWYVITRRALSVGYLIEPKEFYEDKQNMGNAE